MNHDLALMFPPLLAGMLVLATHVPLGRQVLARGIIFIDLALAQLAGLGVILAYRLFEPQEPLLLQGAAFATALLGALCLSWAERRWAERLEALIGVVYVLAISTTILLLANDPHGGERMNQLLAGQLLWVTYGDLLIPAIASAGILLIWFTRREPSARHRFYVLFALSVTFSVQLAGVYLVFASLIVPALATHRHGNLWTAYRIGLFGYLSGLGLSYATDLPSGPLLVWTITLSGLLSVAFARLRAASRSASGHPP
ncbi:MAG: metal ABC transporter permease [Candidatus Thiodiazotropha sp.]